MSVNEDPQPPTKLEVDILATISYRMPPQQTASKGKSTKAPPKGKLENKNKEFTFSFEANDENYLLFLSALLEKHGYAKYTPIQAHQYFTVKIGLGPKKSKKDSLDVEKVSEYREIVKRLITENPTKIITYFNLDDVKVARKRKDVASESDDAAQEVSSENESDAAVDAKASAFEKELARKRLQLEEKYQNPDGGGWSFVTNEGTRQPLTPQMMLEWARAMYDSKATVDMPPNTMAFDPVYRRRSLVQTPKASRSGSGSQSGGSVLSDLSSIFVNARAIFAGGPIIADQVPLGTPWQPAGAPSSITPATSFTTMPVSPPAINSPSKLPAFLKYAEGRLGIQNATQYHDAFDREGYGPDILHLVSNDDIVACGLTPGDALRIKRGAEAWWNSSEAKRHHGDPDKTSNFQVSTAKSCDKIRFIKKYPVDKGGGGLSVFGTGVEDGETPDPEVFTWYYFNKITMIEEPLPRGKVPTLLAEYVIDEPL